MSLPTFSAGICGQKYFQLQWPAPCQKNGFIVAPETGTKSGTRTSCQVTSWAGVGTPYSAYSAAQSWADPSTSSKDKAKPKVNPYQSAFNKLLQFGSSVRATKTAGSYGERPDRTISMGITCNMHPAQYIPMERGEKVPRCHWPTGTTS